MMRYIGSAVAAALFMACLAGTEPPAGFVEQVESLKDQYVPDTRTGVAEVSVERVEDRWIIRGETTSRDFLTSVEAVVPEYFDARNTQIAIRMLPDSVLGDSCHGLIDLSVANIRRSASHRAEMVDQVVMGVTVKLLKREGYWYLVQTPTDYIGWMTAGSFQIVSEKEISEWNLSALVVLNENYAQIRSGPSSRSPVVSDAVLGNIFIATGEEAGWTAVMLPDRRTGYLLKDSLIPYRPPDNSNTPGRDRLVNRARQMMGIPYLWGGRSTKGFDCSGYTGTVFLAEGYRLPRDANMQVHVGEEIIPEDNFENVLPGDLIFFGPDDRITHVGIMLGGSYFIHASEDVHINSLDENDPLFNEYRKKTMQTIKRILKD